MKGRSYPSKAHPQPQAHPWRHPWPSRVDVVQKRTDLRRLATRLLCSDCESEPCRCRA